MSSPKQPRYTQADLEAETDPAARAFIDSTPDALAMLNSTDLEPAGGQELVDYWDTIGRGQGGFYDHIREHGCTSCGFHTPGNCDGCA